MTGTPMSRHVTLRVELGARGYDILVGAGLLATAGQHLASRLHQMRGLRQKRVCVVTDEPVAAAYLAVLARALDEAGIEHQSFVLPAGEETKSFDQLERLIDLLLDARVERSTALVALGGGVIGDLTGFAAAILLRGLEFVQIPTTLLAQVDSSVGGKTAINTRHGKNLVGRFHQPRLVLADTGVLSTLPPRELRAGYAEIVKYGLIGDRAFFEWPETNGAAIIEGDPDARRHAVLTSCAAKARIVAADEEERGSRALLNLGHTFAHALEADVGYDATLLHGEAVAIGLVMAFDLSARLGLCPVEEALRVRRHLARVGLPTGLDVLGDRAWSADALLDHMTRDKKVRDGRITFVLSRGIGQAFISHDVDPTDVRTLLNNAIAA